MSNKLLNYLAPMVEPAPPRNNLLRLHDLSQVPSSEQPRPRTLSDPTATALFFGEKWSGADLNALERAKQDEAAGVSRDEIWRRHLWGRSPSGQWMTETDDSNIAFSDRARRELIDTSGYFRPVALPSNDPITSIRNWWSGAIDAGSPYPDRDLLTNDPTTGRMDTARTFFQPYDAPNGTFGDNTTTVAAAVRPGFSPNVGPLSNPRRLAPGEAASYYRPAPPALHFQSAGLPTMQPLHADHVLSILMHERQHKADVQSGLSPQTMPLQLRRHHNFLEPEVRADAAARRRPMSLDERRNTAPWHSYNVPEPQQFNINRAGKFGVPARFRHEFGDE